MELPSNYREACKLVYIVKGNMFPFPCTEDECESIIDSYTRRIWHNEESWIYEEGFEEKYDEHIRNLHYKYTINIA